MSTLNPKSSEVSSTKLEVPTAKLLISPVSWRTKSNQGALATYTLEFPSHETILRMTEDASNRGSHHVDFLYSADLFYIIKQAHYCGIFSKYNALTRNSIRTQLRETVSFLKSQGFKVKYCRFDSFGPPNKALRWEW